MLCRFLFSLRFPVFIGLDYFFKHGKDNGAHMESQHSEAEAEGSLSV